MSFIRFLIIISKYQLLTRCQGYDIPFCLKFFGKFLELIFFPYLIITKRQKRSNNLSSHLDYLPEEDLSYRLKKALIELGPIYIKFGQTLSTSSSLVGEKISIELRSLQDKLEPFSSEYVKEAIYNNFKLSIEDLFAEFDFDAVSAASIAQVHKAKTKDNQIAAVKILRPGIYKKYNNDIKLLYFFAKFITRNFEKYKRLKLVRVVDVFKGSMERELNLKLEAASSSELATNFAKDKNIYIPKIYWHLTSREILTTEWIDGISIYDKIKLKKYGLKAKDISKEIGVMFFNQAFRDGFFHADLHPGNILIRKDGKIALVDFGIMGRLEKKERLILAEMLFKFFQKDYIAVAKLHLKAGYIPPNTDLNLFAAACRFIYEPLAHSSFQNVVIADLLNDLFKMTEGFGIETQPQLLLLQKTMIVVEGVGRILAPDVNIWDQTRPWVTRWAAKNLSPEAKVLRLIKAWLERNLDLEIS